MALEQGCSILTAGLQVGRKEKQNQTENKTACLVFLPQRPTFLRQKLLGITFPNHWKMPAHPFLLVAMVRDDGARDGYNTRQRAGKGFRGRRDLAVGRGEEGKVPHCSPAPRGCCGPTGEVSCCLRHRECRGMGAVLSCSAPKNA